MTDGALVGDMYLTMREALFEKKQASPRFAGGASPRGDWGAHRIDTWPLRPYSRPVGSGSVRYVGQLFSARTWLAMVYLVSGLPLATIWFSLAVTGIALGVGLTPLALVGLPLISLTLLGCRGVGAIERARVSLMLGQQIAAPDKKVLPDRGWLRRWLSWMTDASSWRQFAAVMTALPLTVFGFAVSVSVWGLALALITLPAYNRDLPKGGAVVFGTTLHRTPVLAAAVAGGAVLLINAPYVTRALAATQVWVDRKLIGPSRRSLAARVGELERSRSRMVVAADADRRRIERDLHDGAQARLVSLAMELGRARAHFDDDPERAKALVSQAHEDAKTALAELRSLVRGVHPPVLSDRGLDAALSGLAAICPVPVSVQVEVTKRPSATVEAVAYFVVAEALTNVAKHSGAGSATVSVRSDGDMLRVAVRDNGRGGAVLTGAGLAGLADRVQAVDGRLSVASPAGGPTLVEVEIPCVS
jgi:signal transduction histidine kinase